MKKITIVIASLALLAGCASTGQLKQLEAENAALRQEKAQYNSQVVALQTAITELKTNIADLTDKMAILRNTNASLTQQTADQQSKLNQDQVVLQVDQDRLERLEKLLVLERAKSEDLKNKVAQSPNGVNAN